MKFYLKISFFKSDQIKENNSQGGNIDAWESYQILIRTHTHTLLMEAVFFIKQLTMFAFYYVSPKSNFLFWESKKYKA